MLDKSSSQIVVLDLFNQSDSRILTDYIGDVSFVWFEIICAAGDRVTKNISPHTHTGHLLTETQ